MSDRIAEKNVFESFLRAKPDFAGELLRNWIQPTQDPPDILCTTTSGRRIGVELGEWLNEDQIRGAKGREAIQESVLKAIGTQPDNNFENIYFAFLHSRPKARVKPVDIPSFRHEILKLARDVDHRWDEEPDWQSPQGCFFEDFTQYPTVGTYIQLVRFFPRRHYEGWSLRGQEVKRTWPAGCDWLVFPMRGGAYSSDAMVDAMRSIIAKKIEKYEAKPPQQRMDDFYLLIHYNQALLYNTPVETLFFKFEDAARAGSEFIREDPGIFGKAFVVLAIWPGERVFQLYPA
jgi:hypothetical protein